MPTKSEGKIVRRRADQVRRPWPERLDEIEAIPDEAIDTSDTPEMAGSRRLDRDENGRLPRRRGGGAAAGNRGQAPGPREL